MVSVHSVNAGFGIATKYFNADVSNVNKVLPAAVDELTRRANKPGQFLSWIDLPKEQLKRVDKIYDLVAKSKNQTDSKVLTVLGIGGSKHPVEHMLSINGLNINKDKVLFFSDVDSTSLARFINRLDNDVTKSNFIVLSKSG